MPERQYGVANAPVTEWIGWPFPRVPHAPKSSSLVVHPAALGWPLSLQFESRSGEELVAAARSSTMPMCFIRWISMCFYGHGLYGKSNPAAFAGNARIH
jgi:hypothetical protein